MQVPCGSRVCAALRVPVQLEPQLSNKYLSTHKPYTIRVQGSALRITTRVQGSGLRVCDSDSASQLRALREYYIPKGSM